MPTSLRGIANKASSDEHHRYRRARCGKTARRDLCGGRFGVPTATARLQHHMRIARAGECPMGEFLGGSQTSEVGPQPALPVAALVAEV
jgi:hypothetical protein